MHKNTVHKTTTLRTNIVVSNNGYNTKKVCINITAIVDDAKRVYLMWR